MKINLLGNRVLVSPKKGENKTPAGILLPEQARGQENAKKGVIVGVGPGETDANGNPLPMLVKEGQQVFYNEYAAVEITIKDGKYLLMRDTDIIGIITE